MLSQVSIMKARIIYDGERLRYYMFSTELPPLLAVGGTKARLMMDVLRGEFGSYTEDGAEVVDLKPLVAPATLVWIVASIVSKPSKALLHALINYTPRSALDLIFELIDVDGEYSKNKPLIPPKKLYAASKAILGILKLNNHPVEVIKT